VSQILAGSDYPHQIGSIPSMMSSLKSLGLSEEEEAAVFGGNAARVYRL
jgi:predicted TIM-barrel fold metal-dependent hydrolase